MSSFKKRYQQYNIFDRLSSQDCFDRSINLLCELRLNKNIAKKLHEMQFSKDIKNGIVADIFGKRRGDVFECGLIDAKREEGFDAMLDNLEQRSSSVHVNGADFHAWFRARKRKEFLYLVVSPVLQREQVLVLLRNALPLIGLNRQIAQFKSLSNLKIRKPRNSLGHAYEFVCISFRTDNINCFKVLLWRNFHFSYTSIKFVF